MGTRFLSLVFLRLLGHSKNSPAENPGEDTRNHLFSHSNTIGMTKLLNRKAGREIGGGGGTKKKPFKRPSATSSFLIPLTELI
jgi:hypothetical protein